MKDNKIDFMCNKLGMMRDMLHHASSINKSNYEKVKDDIDAVTKGIEVLQTDLEVLRKCTVDKA